MSRTWCTTLEESIVSEYLNGILADKKKSRPPKSPYAVSSKPPSAAGRLASARPNTGCWVKKSGSTSSAASIRGSSPYRASKLKKSGSVGSVGSVSSVNSSQLSVYSTSVEGRTGRHFSAKKIIKRVKLFNTPEQSKIIVASNYGDLLERCRSHHLFTSDSTLITPELYKVLPHNCHLFTYDPATPPSQPKPKVVWTKDGVVVSGAKQRTVPHLSERLQRLTERKKQRVGVLRNGEHRALVSITEGPLTAMITEASELLAMPVTALYTVEGTALVEGEPAPHVVETAHTKGPLWATRGGEVFSFVGAYSWCRAEQRSLRKEIKLTQGKLEKAYELEASEERTGQLQSRITALEEALANLRGVLENISADVFEEEAEGEARFRVKNMPEIRENSRLIGRQNVKVNVYINARDVEPRTVVIPGGTFKPTLDWLLEEAERAHRGTLGGTTQKASVLYSSSGDLVTQVLEIEPDTDLYLSYGEPFAAPRKVEFLEISFYGVTAHSFPDTDRLLLERRQLEKDETVDPAKQFRVAPAVPSTYRLSENYLRMKQKPLKFAVAEIQSRQIFEEHSFLQHKKRPQRLIYPNVGVGPKSTPSPVPSLLSHHQTWIYTATGEIRPKAFPRLCLSVSPHSILHRVGGGGEDAPTAALEGYLVELSAERVTQWTASTEGTLTCPRTGLHLTLLEESAEFFSPSSPPTGLPRQSAVRSEGEVGEGSYTVYGLEEPVGIPSVPGGEEARIVALPALSGPAAANQRWAWKQESLAVLGQWKLCEVPNPQWGRECLSWPTNPDGQLNTKLTWPMEGLLLSRAPSLRAPKPGPSSTPPLRLRVRYTGTLEPSPLVTVPDLTNMRKDLAMRRENPRRTPDRQPDTERWLERHRQEPLPAEDRARVSDLEFRLFLDKCGQVLGLVTPPTRLFGAGGEELESLDSLSRDTEVFVSCGAEFETPDCEKNARNRLLHDVTDDVNKIKTFCSALAPTEYIACVREAKRHATVRLGPLTDSDTTGLLLDGSVSDILEIAETNRSLDESPVPPAAPVVPEPRRGFHFKSHVTQNESDLEAIEQFPWRNPAFTAGLIKDKLDWAASSGGESEGGESEGGSDCGSVRSVRSGTSSTGSLRRRATDRPCGQWLYKDCRFFLLERPQLVLSLGPSNAVELAPYDKTAPEQCWTLDEGFIYSCTGQALTITHPAVSPPAPLDYTGSRLKVAPLQPTGHGNTAQKWRYDDTTGHLLALAGSPLCRAVNAALLAKLCTYAVTGTDNTEQPTYIMENPGISGIPPDNTHIYVCGSCATSLRDRHSLDRIDPTPFVCSVGYYSATAGLGLRSSLAALAGLEGLAPDRALGTLYLWESVLGDLRSSSSLQGMRDAVKQTLQLECPNEGLALLRCYLNGAGPPRHSGALFLARTREEILRRCQAELRPGRPLSRIFRSDGSEVANFQGLLGEGADGRGSFYSELFVSGGEAFIRPRRPKGPSFKKRLKLYQELSKLDVSSIMGISGVRPRAVPSSLPVGKQAIPVYIRRNGDFWSDAEIRVVAGSLGALLEMATTRLNLARAARRVFSGTGGAEITAWEEVGRGAVLVVSTGEALVRKEERPAGPRKGKWLQRRIGYEK